MKIETEFDIRDRVIINGDHNVVTTVQRITVSSNGVVYEVNWFDGSGSYREQTFYDWQLTKKED